MNKKLFKLLCCPECKNDLKQSTNFFQCIKCHKKYPITNGIPNFSITVEEEGMQVSQKKWDEKYVKDSKKNIVKELDFLEKKFFRTTYEQLLRQYKLKKSDLFLELGCGTFYLGRKLTKMGHTVVGIDMSMEALKIAKKIFEKEGHKNYLLVCGNVLNMPFKKNSFDLLYGAGVIEHFKDTLQSVTELNRVLKKGGVAFNTVPMLNVGSLTYRQIWGNIPRFPIIEQILTFVHLKLLRAKHLIFGYELSFTRGYQEKIHKKAGFKKVKTGQWECELDFDYIKIKPLKRLAIHLATNSSLFWPMMYIAAKK